MKDIPADVMKAARNQCDLCGITPTSVMRVHAEHVAAFAIMAERERFMNEFEGAADSGIDAAVMAERNRCAEIAESFIEKKPATAIDAAMSSTAEGIVYGIRNPNK